MFYKDLRRWQDKFPNYFLDSFRISNNTYHSCPRLNSMPQVECVENLIKIKKQLIYLKPDPVLQDKLKSDLKKLESVKKELLNEALIHI